MSASVAAIFSLADQRKAFGEYLIDRLFEEGKIKPESGGPAHVYAEPFDVLGKPFIPFLVRVTIGRQVYEEICTWERAVAALIVRTFRNNRVMAWEHKTVYRIGHLSQGRLSVIVEYDLE